MTKALSSDSGWQQQTVSSAMTPDPVIFHEQDPLLEILELFDSAVFEHLPISDSADNLTGIISFKEISAIRHMLEHLPEAEKEIIYQKTAESIMKRPVLTISGSDSLGKAAKIMLENSIHALPVTNRNSVIGIITSSDILRAALQQE